jgi:hypothetical protein
MLAVALTACGDDGESATEAPATPGETVEGTPGQAVTQTTGVVDTGRGDTAGVDDGSTSTPIAAEEAVRDLVTRWYTATDPAVCEEMTDDFLQLVYGAPGAEGREACGQSVTQPPLENVEIGAVVIEGDQASVDVGYRVSDREVVDRLGVIQENGRWLLDSYETLPG